MPKGSKQAFFSFVLLFFTAAAARAELPEYKVFRTGAPIIIDGTLNDHAWANATPAYLVRNADGKKLAVRTEARILYDDKYLYFSFSSQDENIWATMKERDAHLWEEEVVEVFLQPDPAKKNYIELEVNPLGAMLDIYLLDIRKPLFYESWNSAKLQWAAQVDGTVDGKPGDKAWTCEIAFPLEDAATAPNFPPKPGDTWRMNLNRVEVKPNAELLSWSPTGKDDFHMLAMFGKLVFK
jgi:hypothetical protein